MGRHESAGDTFDAMVDDYVTGRARELVRQFDLWQDQPPDVASATVTDWVGWCGSAAEILRELTRDA